MLFLCLSLHSTDYITTYHGATTAEKLRRTKVWVPTPGRLRPAPGQRPGWGGCGRGSPPAAVVVRGVTPEIFLETQMLNPACWWLLRSLAGSRGRVYPSKQQECSKISTFQPWLRPWLLEPKTNQMEIMKHVNCMQHVIL